MNHYEQEINLYFELKGTPESSRESYLRRINAFVNFMQDKHKCREDIQGVFINFYTLYEQTYTLSPQQAKACNDKICLSFMDNTRIVSMDEQTVTITVRDNKNSSQTKTLTLKGVEFVRRFLMHILPKGFVKIRHYGLLANRNKKTKLELCRKLTCSPDYKAKFEGLKTIEILCILVGRSRLRSSGAIKNFALSFLRKYY